VSSYFSMSSQG